MKHIIFDYNGPIIKADNFYENRSKRIADIFDSEWTLGFQEVWRINYALLSVGKIGLKDYYNNIAKALGKETRGKKDKWHIEEDKLFVQGDTLADENIPQYLQQLKEDYPEMKIGLLSNYVQHWVTETLDRYEIRKHFDVYVISNRMKRKKPDLSLLRLTADVMGVPTYDIGFVADTVVDLVAANEVGMKAYFIAGEEINPKKFSMINNIGELERFLYYDKPKKTLRKSLIKLLS